MKFHPVFLSIFGIRFSDIKQLNIVVEAIYPALWRPRCATPASRAITAGTAFRRYLNPEPECLNLQVYKFGLGSGLQNFFLLPWLLVTYLRYLSSVLGYHNIVIFAFYSHLNGSSFKFNILFHLHIEQRSLPLLPALKH
jgi:hypothetical protein